MQTIEFRLSALSMFLVLVWMAVPAVAQQCEWSPVGSGMNSSVLGLTGYDDVTVPALYGLYAGGFFTMAGGVPANRIAKWDGTQWSPLGSGMNDWAFALTVFDDGTGPALYAGGYFTTAGGGPANYIAAWRCVKP